MAETYQPIAEVPVVLAETLALGDYITIIDVSDGNKLKRVLLSQFKRMMLNSVSLDDDRVVGGNRELDILTVSDTQDVYNKTLYDCTIIDDPDHPEEATDIKTVKDAAVDAQANKVYYSLESEIEAEKAVTASELLIAAGLDELSNEVPIESLSVAIYEQNGAGATLTAIAEPLIVIAIDGDVLVSITVTPPEGEKITRIISFVARQIP